MKTYKEIYKELYSLTQGLIKHYKTDLTVHDKRIIKDNHNKPFLHITRATGTAMFVLDDCKQLDQLDRLEEMVRFHLKESRPLLILYHDSKKGFKKLNSKQAEEIFRKYREGEERKARIEAIEEEQQASKYHILKQFTQV